MGKIRTHKATAKRIKVTKSGKLLRRSGNISHFMEKKREGRKRGLRASAQVHSTRERGVKKALGI